MKKIPLGLIYFRLIAGLALLLIGIIHVTNYKRFGIILLITGLSSDVFDGIIARRLGCSSEKLRRLDSTVDQIFWCLVAASVFIQYPHLFHTHAREIITLLIVEAITYVICFTKFRKEVATHAISSKVWTLIMFATLVELMLKGNSSVLFEIFFYTGIASRLEIIIILLVLKSWANDIPTFYHAIKLRKGKIIKRHKLFNG